MEILNAFKILREQHSIPENLSTNEEQETQILQKQSKKDSIHGSGKPSKVQVKIRGISSQSKKKTNDKYSQNFSSHDPSVQFKHHQSMINQTTQTFIDNQSPSEGYNQTSPDPVTSFLEEQSFVLTQDKESKESLSKKAKSGNLSVKVKNHSFKHLAENF